MSYAADALFRLDGKAALVTGGSSGVGRMIATVLAANGARVYIVGRKLDRLEQAAAEIAAHGDCRALQADLSQMDELDRVAQVLGSAEDRLHILVNNAGASWGGSIDAYPEAGWDRVMNLNAKHAFFLTQKLLPLLDKAATQADPARIINLSSVATLLTDAGSIAYGASKAAVEQLTRTLCRGFDGRWITVNSISPGWFPSRMNAPLPDEARDAWVAQTPLRRLGDTAEMGGTAVYLCSRAGGFINGQNLVLDGGRTV